MLHRLGEATTKIADRADKNGDKLRDLGQALTEASGDEEIDEEAARAPKRGRKKP